MAVLTFAPTRTDFQGIVYPAISSQTITLTNVFGFDVIVTGTTLNNPQFTFTDVSVVSTLLADTDTGDFTVDSNWYDPYLDGNQFATLVVRVSGRNQTPAVSTVSFAISAFFDGLEFPSNTVTAPSGAPGFGFAYDSPQDHARLYVTGII